MEDSKLNPDTASEARDSSMNPSKTERSIELKTGSGDIDNTNSAHEFPEKRGSSRQRRPVVLMQSQYDELYATFHSRSKKAKELDTAEKEETNKVTVEDSSCRGRHKRAFGLADKGETTKASGQVTSIVDADERKAPIIEIHSRSSSRLAARIDKKRKQDTFLFSETKKKTKRSSSETNNDFAQEHTDAVSSQVKRPRRRDEEVVPDQVMDKRPKKVSKVSVGRETPEISLDLSSQNLNRRGSAQKNTNDDNEDSQEINESSSFGDNDDLTEEFPRNPRQFTKGPITEGATTEGQIRVGSMYQASVPTLRIRTKYISTRRENAVKVWHGGAIDDTALTSFLESAVALLTYYLKKSHFYTPPTNTLLQILAPRKMGECAPERKLDGIPKELNIDAILALLHEKSYDCTAALNVIEKSPEWFVDLWSKRDRDTYDAGFSKYFSNLRNISRGFGDSKSFRDVVDYHFRHKIPEQFRRYQESKLLQARRMLQAVESRRMQDTSNEKCEVATSVNVSATRVDHGNNAVNMPTASNPKKYRHWFGNNSRSELEKRRTDARDFLLLVHDALGQEKYNHLIKCMKEYKNKDPPDLARLKNSVSRLFVNHSGLLKRFQDFLPQDLRK